ncbi:MAG TPA: hypothetical protein VLB84_07505 [Bacteroidia bacterium]|nr:hypothetical protein [Bacteroidia bacterium]
MKLLTTTKTTYLLEAGLEVPHAQCNEWLNEIAFWRDESAFFYTLVINKKLKSVPVNAKSSINKIEQELLNITGGDLDALQKEVEQHETFLNDLLESKYMKEENYRKSHEQLTFKFYQFEKRFKDLKREVFKLVKKINKSK